MLDCASGRASALRFLPLVASYCPCRIVHDLEFIAGKSQGVSARFVPVPPHINVDTYVTHYIVLVLFRLSQELQ